MKNRKTIPLANGTRFSAEAVFDHMDARGKWGLEKFAVGLELPSKDSFYLTKAWIQDGFEKHHFKCECWINESRRMRYLEFIKAEEDKVGLLVK